MDQLPTGSGGEIDQFGTMIGLQIEQPNLLEATKRRSSNRSIKRRRFDDEIVESSLGNQGALTASKVARTRTHSTSSPGVGPYTRYLPSPQPTTPVTTTATACIPVTEAVAPATFPPPPPAATTMAAAAVPVAVVPAATPPSASGAEVARPRRAPPKPVPASGRRNRRPGRHQHSVATKDLGRWKPTDDLALILGVQQTNDMRTVHRGVKFSCRFTVQELQQRWYALLYEPSVSRIAVAAMRNLHPEMVAAVQGRALYSKPEEQLLATIKPVPNPTVQTFQELLEKNAHLFHPGRTPKALLTHWLLMKQYHLLPDQTVQSLPRGEHVLNFSDAEDLIADGELIDPRDIRCEKNLAQADRKGKKEMRKLENEIGRWQVLVDSVTGISPPDFDNQTLAVLRGRLVRYLMRSREITVGRTTHDHSVDIDLSLEGPAWKVSRRQGTIRLRNNGDFFISSEGKRAIYVDGRPILAGNKFRLNNNSVIEIASLRFIFLVNQELINVIRHEAAKMNLQP